MSSDFGTATKRSYGFTECFVAAGGAPAMEPSGATALSALKTLLERARAFPGNPLDGHTLSAQLEQTTNLKFPRHQPEFSCPINHLRWISGLPF